MAFSEPGHADHLEGSMVGQGLDLLVMVQTFGLSWTIHWVHVHGASTDVNRLCLTAIQICSSPPQPSELRQVAFGSSGQVTHHHMGPMGKTWQILEELHD